MRVLSCWPGRPRRSNSRVNCRSATACTCPPSARLVMFRRPCRSVIWPERKASVVSVLASSTCVTFLSAARKVDRRASCKGMAQGSARWSAPPERPSSRRISRDQSSAPIKIHADCTRPRSAVSTSTARHCCHIAAAAKVATSVTVSMAASSAAPRALCLCNGRCHSGCHRGAGFARPRVASPWGDAAQPLRGVLTICLHPARG